MPQLYDVHQAEISLLYLQSNTVTKKNSGSRNLHRLLTAVLFVSGLLQNMAKNSATTLRQVRTAIILRAVPLCLGHFSVKLNGDSGLQKGFST